jgi:signal transduction histidine kinase
MKTTQTIRHVAIAAALGLAVTSLMPLSAQAWGRSGRGPSPEQAAQRLAQDLGLTPEQQGQVQQVLEENFARREALRKEHREEASALRNQAHERLAAVLSAEQAAKLNELREARRDRAERRGECDRKPGRRGDKGGRAP